MTQETRNFGPKQTPLTFNEWKGLMDRALVATCGLSSDDLPDWDMWSAWDAGTLPNMAASEALRNACDDMCMDYDSIFGG